MCFDLRELFTEFGICIETHAYVWCMLGGSHDLSFSCPLLQRSFHDFDSGVIPRKNLKVLLPLMSSYSLRKRIILKLDTGGPYAGFCAL